MAKAKTAKTDVNLQKGPDETDDAFQARLAVYTKALAEAEADDEVEAKVRRGRTVKHNGETYRPGESFLCSEADRARFLKLGSIEGGVEVPSGIGPVYDRDVEKPAKVMRLGGQ